MKRMASRRSAFTLIEVVFAIVILGIVASISSSIIVQVYSAYLQQRTVHNASIKSELAISQIANRLLYRIDRSVVARKPGQFGNTYGTDLFPLREVPNDGSENDYKILEWIGYDNDSFSTSNRPGWSGYCNVNGSNFTTLSTPGTYGGTALSKLKNYYGAQSGAVVFSGWPDYRTDAGVGGGSYLATCMFETGGNGCIFPVTNLGGDSADFIAGKGDRQAGRMIYTEFYKYALTAFAVVPENEHYLTGSSGLKVWDLKLYYGYQPWEGENYKSANTESSLILQNVSVFRFIKETNNVRIKLCVVEKVGSGSSDHYSICKEKAVIR